jgi:CheY-like chemotaxis protein
MHGISSQGGVNMLTRWPGSDPADMHACHGRYEVMTERLHPKLRHLPVVVLMSYERPQRPKNVTAWCCNSYITKPVDFDNFVKPLGNWRVITVVVVLGTKLTAQVHLACSDEKKATQRWLFIVCKVTSLDPGTGSTVRGCLSPI